jgi:predicted branched-subunit amino acid permease
VPPDTDGSPAIDLDGATRRAVLSTLPLAAGYLPFALVVGSTAADQGAPVAGWAGSWLIYAGSAHLAAMRTLGDAGALAAIVTALLINARLVIYSASLARRWAAQPRWFWVVAAPMIVDPTWALAERQADAQPDPQTQRRMFLGAALAFGTVWSAGIAVGAIVGARLDGVDLRFVVPLGLLGLLGRSLADARDRWVMAAAALAALVCGSWPAGTGVLVAVAAGSAAGSLLSRGARP